MTSVNNRAPPEAIGGGTPPMASGVLRHQQFQIHKPKSSRSTVNDEDNDRGHYLLLSSVVSNRKFLAVRLR